LTIARRSTLLRRLGEDWPNYAPTDGCSLIGGGDFIGGVNQYQVAIYNNSTPSNGENPDDPYALQPGGVMWTEFNLMATLRAHTAREAVQIMGNLAQAHMLSGDPGTCDACGEPVCEHCAGEECPA